MTSRDSAFSFLAQGAIIQEFIVADRNIVLNLPQPSHYLLHNSSYFGETIGRVANRIRDAKLSSLNGRSYDLVANNGPNSLHGGCEGWGKKTWSGPKFELRNNHETAVYFYRSIDGEEGYPGTVDASVAYTGFTTNDSGLEKTVLNIEYEIKMADEQPLGVEETVVNVTNHSYFNISGTDTIEGTRATLATDLHLPLDSNGIPSSGPERHKTVMADKMFVLGSKEPVFDDCFVLEPSETKIPLDTRYLPLRAAAAFEHPSTGVHLEVLTTEPAFQFYTGEYVDVPEFSNTPARGPRAGFCVEPSRYINAANVDEWKNMVLLKKGDVYGSRIVYRAWKAI